MARQVARMDNWSCDGGNAGQDDREDGINEKTWEVGQDQCWVSPETDWAKEDGA